MSNVSLLNFTAPKPITTSSLNAFLTDLSIKLSYSVSSFGVVFDLICVLVFISMIRKTPNLRHIKSTKFLLFKCTVEFFHNTNRLVVQSTECSHCLFDSYLPIVYIRLVQINYVATMCSLMSTITEVFVNLERLIAIIDAKKYSKYLNFNYSIAFIILYPLLFYIFKFFDTYVESRFDPMTNSTFYLIKTSKQPVFEVLRFIHSLVRDVLCVSILFFINLLLMYRFRMLLSRKKQIEQNLGHTSNARKENNLTIMFIITGFICIVGHVPMFIRYLPVQTIKNLIDSTNWFTRLAEDFFYLSISLDFFVYMIFDLKFRATFFSLFFQNSAHSRLSENLKFSN